MSHFGENELIFSYE
jgi:hypothetical protein